MDAANPERKKGQKKIKKENTQIHAQARIII